MIEVLIGMNQQLAAKLSEKSQSELSKNKYKRSQGSIPRSDSYSKMVSGFGPLNQALEGTQPSGAGPSSSLVGTVSNNLISNFDKLVAGELTGGDHSKMHPGPNNLYAYPPNPNKENYSHNSNKDPTSSKPRIPQKPNELLKDVLVERKILVAMPPDREREAERPSAMFGGPNTHQVPLNSQGAGKYTGVPTQTLMPQGYLRSSQSHQMGPNSASSPQRGATLAQSGTLIGLHQIELGPGYQEGSTAENQAADPKLYSSKYSRHSRNSRNSINSGKRSPSPAKPLGDKFSPVPNHITP
jgi:hypothetical protein